MENIEERTINAVKKVLPSVVSIVISKNMPKVKRMPFAPLFGPFGMPDQPDIDDDAMIPHEHNQHLGGNSQKIKIGGGSGFIVHPDGLVLTNKHVVFDPDSEYTIITEDEKEYHGRVISRDPINDVAVLKIDAKGLPPVRLGNK